MPPDQDEGFRAAQHAWTLARLEELLAVHYEQTAGIPRDSFRLCQFFDYVAGTSTGAIIAAAIARGARISEVHQLYRDFGKIAFTKSRWYNRWKTLHEHSRLSEQLKAFFTAEATLEPQHLHSLLLLVTRNAATDSAWPISSNPDALFNALDRPNCNLKLPLWKIIRTNHQ